MQAWDEAQDTEEFPVEYSTWSGMQRSIDQAPIEEQPKFPQLVINVIASDKMRQEMKSNPALYKLFDDINTTSQGSGHPYAKDQIGWARLELDPKGQFILVDEIQSDHSNTIAQMKQANQDIYGGDQQN